MKVYYFFLFIALMTYRSQAQKTDYQGFTGRFHPPGTIKINDSLYIDKSPVTNVMYLEFLNSVKMFWSPDKSDSILSNVNIEEGIYIPDTLELSPEQEQFYHSMEIPTNQLIQDEKSADLYLKDEKYSDYPVLQITKTQAEMFCKWRTDMVKLHWQLTDDNVRRRPIFPDKLEYRLPEIEEFQNAVDYFTGMGLLKASRENKPLKIRPRNYNRDRFYLYNISEITASGYYGENWKEEPPGILPNDQTGFRCICEVK